MKVFLTLSLLLLSVSYAQWDFDPTTYQWEWDPVTDSDHVDDHSDPNDEYTDSDPSDSLGICWKPSYGRNSYNLATKCDKGLIRIGSYCYQPCKEGYTDGYFSGFLPQNEYDPQAPEYSSDVESYCWEDCPQGYEKWANLCKNADTGTEIHVKSYNRSYVQALKCSPNLVLFNDYCYERAKDGFKCDGPMCYGKCPRGWDECGALCTKNGLCVGQVKDEGFGVAFLMMFEANSLKDPSQVESINATAIEGVLNGTLYPWCH